MAEQVKADPRLIGQLDSFDARERRRALRALAAGAEPARLLDNVNMHCHSFFSYNARGWSPSRVAWEARQAGLYAAGLCDFDVLDGLEEFLEAGLVLRLRVAVHLETRAFLEEYAGMEINSPGEPGVTYIMGAGFVRVPAPNSPAAATLADLRARAAARNRALVARINAHLDAVAIDYDREVVPLSPGGCPTERHIVRAYVDKAAAVFTEAAARARFWCQVLGAGTSDPAAAAGLMADRPRRGEQARMRLVARGGLGYEPPTPQTFPRVGDFTAWVLACEAIPMVTWLDGTSAGEADPAAMLECLRAKGAAAVNIIPDRNWRTSAAQRPRLLKLLDEFVRTAQGLDLPINIGTEMNREGQPFSDDLDVEYLRPYREVFLEGARVMVGHTILSRYAGYAYTGAAARAEFGGDVRARNRFFAAVGALPPLDEGMARRLEALGPEAALRRIRDAVTAGRWS